MNQQKSIILIGMPGSGKSTVGVLLAKYARRSFIDTDILIQLRENATLQQILDERGYLALRQAEENAILGASFSGAAVATGGSAVYSRCAMEHLRKHGLIVHLRVGLEEIRRRVRDFSTRGIASPPGQSLEQIFAERNALYEEYADCAVLTEGRSHEEVMAKILAACAEAR